MSQSPDGAGRRAESGRGAPGDGASALRLAAVQNETGRYAEALRTLAPYTARHPDDVRGLGLRAQALLGLGEPKEAALAARAAVGLAPGEEWALRLLSIASLRQGQYRQAREAAVAARTADPDGLQPHLLLLHIDLTSQQVGPGTLRTAGEAVRLAPGDSSAHNALGLVLVALGRLDEGEAAYRESLRLDPQSEEARHNLSLLDLRRGNVGKAAADFMNALAVSPGDKQVTLSLARAAAAWLKRISATLWLLFVADAVVVVALYTHNQAASKLAARLFAALIVVALVFWVLWIRETAGVRFFRFLRALPRIDKLLAVRTALLAAAAVIMLVSAVLPAGQEYGFYGIVALAVATLAALLWNARISRRARRVLLLLIIVAVFVVHTIIRLAGHHPAPATVDFPTFATFEPVPTDLFDFPTDFATLPSLPPLP